MGLSKGHRSWNAFYGHGQRWQRTPWRLTDSSLNARSNVLTVALQVADFEESNEDSVSWVVGHNFRSEHAPLVASWAIRPTLMTYSHKLAQARDSASRHQREVGVSKKPDPVHSRGWH